VSDQPFSLAWCAGGAYLAAGTQGAGKVFVVKSRTPVTTTLKATGWVQGVAFSADGKWLAVITRQSNPPGAVPAELLLFDVPAFTLRFTARAGRLTNSFTDLAWAADSRGLCVLDSRVVPLDRTTTEKAVVRRWTVPAFTEQPAIPAVKTGRYAALAVSPDGRTLAVLDDTGLGGDRQVVRLLDRGSGVEHSAFKVGTTQPFTPRLGYTPDGKTFVLFEQDMLSCWEVTTGRPAKPTLARVAIPPAGLSTAHHPLALSPDGSRQAKGHEEHPITGMGLNDILFAPKNRFGTFVRLTEGATARSWTWRVGTETDSYADAPAVAFSSDGTKLACTVKQREGGAILIWAVPK